MNLLPLRSWWSDIAAARACPNQVAFEESQLHSSRLQQYCGSRLTVMTQHAHFINTGEPIVYSRGQFVNSQPFNVTTAWSDTCIFASSLASSYYENYHGARGELSKAFNETLEQQVSKRTQELERANDQLDIISKIRPANTSWKSAYVVAGVRWSKLRTIKGV